MVFISLLEIDVHDYFFICPPRYILQQHLFHAGVEILTVNIKMKDYKNDSRSKIM